MARRTAVAALVVLAIATLAACPSSSTPRPIPPGPPTEIADAGSDHVEQTPPPPPSDPPPPPPSDTPLADGSPCLTGEQCASGKCEGQGCGDDTPGTCAPATRGCTKDRRPYCGCDHVTFYTSGSCPGRRYQARGACQN